MSAVLGFTYALIMYINPYFQGTKRIFPEPGRYECTRFDMNENPVGLPIEFVEKVKKGITPEFLATYPETQAFTQKYARFIGLEPENIMTTNGSDMGIRYLLETFGKPGSKVVTVAPSFEMYRINCSLLGLQHTPIDYNDDLSFDHQNLLNAIDAETSVVSLLNPNNPIGNVFSAVEVEEVIQKAQTVGALVIIDEAYHYFHPITFLHFIRQYDNVVILRTFSKCFALAGCRLGVIIGPEHLIQAVTRARLTFDVNSIALLFGEALLDEPEILAQLIESEKRGKTHLIEKLESHGYCYMGGAGNYIFIKPKLNPSVLAEKLQAGSKILVKTFGHPLLRDYIRVTTGNKASMDLFLNAFFKEDNN